MKDQVVVLTSQHFELHQPSRLTLLGPYPRPMDHWARYLPPMESVTCIGPQLLDHQNSLMEETSFIPMINLMNLFLSDHQTLPVSILSLLFELLQQQVTLYSLHQPNHSEVTSFNLLTLQGLNNSQ